MANTRHPSPERLDRYLQGLLRGAVRDAVERHFMICDVCFERVREQLGAELVGAGSSEHGAKPPRRSD
jgi:hypothetical protein